MLVQRNEICRKEWQLKVWIGGEGNKEEWMDGVHYVKRL